MQSVAWVTMIVDFSRDASLVEAVGKTFDGEHPCSLCKAVASGQEEERERQSTLADPLAKLVAVLAAEVLAVSLPSVDEVRYFPFGARPCTAEDSLPSPPPRLA